MIFSQNKTRDYHTLDRLYGLPIADCRAERPGLFCRLKALLSRR